MGMEQKTHFAGNRSKGIQYGECIGVCSGMVIGFGQDEYPKTEYERSVQKDRNSGP